MSDISAASTISNYLRQSSVSASHDAYNTARTGQNQIAKAVEKTASTLSSDFDSNGGFLRSSGSKSSSTLSQAINFLT